MTGYRIDPERSTVTAVVRPMLDGRGALDATITGRIATDHGTSPITGQVEIRLAGTAAAVALDLAGTSPELDEDRDGTRLLRGSATRPAGAFGLAGPPLLNPTVVLRWRAVLVPDEA